MQKDLILEPTTVKPINYTTVDAESAGWNILIIMQGHYRHRIYFENSSGFKNSMQMDQLRGWMQDQYGTENHDWKLQPSEFDMQLLWNRSQDCEEKRMYGNSIYVRDILWLNPQLKINQVATDVEYQEVFDKITVIETRT